MATEYLSVPLDCATDGLPDCLSNGLPDDLPDDLLLIASLIRYTMELGVLRDQSKSAESMVAAALAHPSLRNQSTGR